MQPPPNKKLISGKLYVVMAAILWGTTGTSQALAPANANPLTIAALRMSIGGFVLIAIALFRKRIRINDMQITKHILFAAMSVTAYQLFFFSSVIRTGVAIGTLITISSSPIFGGAIGYLIRGERLNLRWYAATILAITGTILLTFSAADTKTDPLGILLAIGAGFSYALYVFLNKKILETQAIDVSLAIIFFLGGLLLTPLLFIQDISWVLNPRGMAVAINLGITTVVIAYTLFAQGLSLLPVSEATTLTLAEPLTASILGIFFLRETLTPKTMLGIFFIFIGLLTLFWKAKQPLQSKNTYG